MLKIEKSELIKMLKFSELSLTEKSINVFAKSILFICDERGLTLRTTSPSNSETIITSPNVEVTEPFTFMADSFLLKILKGYPNDGVLSISLENDKITLTAGKNRNRFDVIDYEDYPDLIQVPKLKYIKIEDISSFCSMFRKMAFALANVHDNKTLYGFHINPHEKSIITSNGNQIVETRKEDLNFGNIACIEGSLLLPLISVISGLSSEDTLEVFFGAINCFRITEGNNVAEVKIISIGGDFPPAREILHKLEEIPCLSKIKIKKSDLLPVIRQAVEYYTIAYNRGTSEITTIEVEDNEIVVTMSVQNFSDMRVAISCEVTGEKTKLDIFSKELAEGIGSMAEDIEINIYPIGSITEGKKSPIILKNKKDNTFAYLQVQMGKQGD